MSPSTFKATGVPHLYEVNYPAEGQCGFLVKLNRRQKRVYKIFNLKRYASPEQCFRAAEDYALQIARDYPRLSRRDRAGLRRSHFRGEMIGVRRTVRVVRGRSYAAWQATWSPERGVVRKVWFSVIKYGEEEAHARAIAARQQGLAALSEPLGTPGVILDVALL